MTTSRIDGSNIDVTCDDFDRTVTIQVSVNCPADEKMGTRHVVRRFRCPGGSSHASRRKNAMWLAEGQRNSPPGKLA